MPGKNSDTQDHMKPVYNLSLHPRKFGSVEHFFHFMWGYLLPSIHLIQTQTNPATSLYRFRSCGPLMDPLLEETMLRFEYDFKIFPDKNPSSVQSHNLIVPRWDVRLTRRHRKKEKNRPLPSRLIHTVLDLDLKFAAEINAVRSAFIEHTPPPNPTVGLSRFRDTVLLIKRSAPHKFYEKGGHAEISGYGTTRRTLHNLSETRDALRSSQIPAEIFEPGKHTLFEQIYVFNHCAGMIGIRGAEFANLIWMKPKTPVVMIQPPSMDHSPLHKALTHRLQLRYHKFIADETCPPLDPAIFKPA